MVVKGLQREVKIKGMTGVMMMSGGEKTME